MSDAKGFIVLKTHVPGIELLTREQKGLLLEALIADTMGSEKPQLDPVTNVVFTMMLPSIHEAQEEYERKAQTLRENGAKGGRPKKQQPEQETNRFSENQQVFEKPIGFEETSRISENQNRIELNRIEKSINSPPIVPPPGGEMGACDDPDDVPDEKYPADFEAFWSLYPRKEGKHKAGKAWKTHRKSIPNYEKLKAAIDWQKTSDQWQRGIIPHAATWLNGHRWEDQRPVQESIPFESIWEDDDERR